jgi:hypothetical protein
MTLERRKFIQMTALGLATVMSGISLPTLAKQKKLQPLGPGTRPLSITMPTPDGKYQFLVDGKKQVISISGEKGNLEIPDHSCIIEYTGDDGTTELSVYIDHDTTGSFLYPGMPSKETEAELEWDAVLLGNPIRGGKVVASITGPANTNPEVEIFDMRGKTLIKEKVSKSRTTDQFTFDVQPFAKGMLLVKVSCEEFTKTLKVMHGN